MVHLVKSYFICEWIACLLDIRHEGAVCDASGEQGGGDEGDLRGPRPREGGQHQGDNCQGLKTGFIRRVNGNWQMSDDPFFPPCLCVLFFCKVLLVFKE